MNFDFPDAVMKFLITTNGDLKTFHLAFERAFGDVRFFVKTAGMNSKGLFGACQELHPDGDSPKQPEKDPLHVFELYEKIDGAGDVHDLETILEKARLVNLSGLNLHNLFADTRGKAMVTEAGDTENEVTRMEGRYMVMTNFPNHSLTGKTYADAEGKGAERYILCHEYLKDTVRDFTLENGLELLEKTCNREPEYPTSCSMVFDPQNREVYVALFRDFKRIFKVSVEKGTLEPWRGLKGEVKAPVAIGDGGLLVSELT